MNFKALAVMATLIPFVEYTDPVRGIIKNAGIEVVR